MIKTRKPRARQRSGLLLSATRHNFSFGYNNYNSNRFDPQSKILRVNKKNPCKICGQSDWCGYKQEEGLAFCMRVSAGSTKTASNGAYMHELNPQDRRKVSATSASSIRNSGNSGNQVTENYRADVDHLNEVYTFLLTRLQLADHHAENLLDERGLSDTTIAANLYASVPSVSDLSELMEQVREKFGDNLKGVAGFYKDESGIWQFNRPQGGFFVPYRDEKGRIQALQIRLVSTGKSKYIWLSTNPDNNEKFKDGTSSGAPLHFVLPDLVKETGEIIITEGALKADCIAEFTGKSVVALAGVTCANFEELPAHLKKALPELQTITIAYDADFITNTAVRTALLKLSRSLEKFGYEVGILLWDSAHGKGLDDLLVNEIREVENER